MTLPRTIASLLLAAPVLAAAQEQDGTFARLPLLSQAFAQQSEPLRMVDDDELAQIHSMIERLEVGMSALADAGAEELLREVQHLAIDLRKKAEVIAAQRAHGEQAENDWGDFNDLGFRLDVLRSTRKAYHEVGEHEVAKFLEACIHIGELQLTGGDPEVMAQAMEGFSMERLIEMLRRGGRIWMEIGDEHRAHLSLKLAEFYAWRDGVGGEEPAEEVEPRQWGDLNDRVARLQLLALSAHVLERAGMQEQAHHMHQMVRYGTLQENGGSEEEMAELAASLSMESMYHGVETAAELMQEWGNDSEAHHLRSLLHFYYERDGVIHEGGEDDHGSEEEAHETDLDLENKEVRLKILAGAVRVLHRGGHGEAAEYLQRFVALGKLQLSGASDDEVLAASEGLTMDGAHECLALASEILAAGGYEGRTRGINALREFYYVRDGGAAPDQVEEEPPAELEYEDLETRIEIVTGAARVLARTGHEELADYLNRFQTLGHMQLAGASAEEIAGAAEGLSMDGMHECLAVAADLLAERGAHERAHVINALREYYYWRDGGGEGGGEDHTEDENPLNRDHYDLEQRSERLLVVEMGIDAHREAGNEDWIEVMGRFYRYGQMQEAGASDEELMEHAAGLSMDHAIKGLKVASELYAEWGLETRSHWCAALSKHYYEQTYGSDDDEEAAEAILWELEQAVAAEPAVAWNAPLEERDDARRNLDEVYSEMDRLYVQMAELQARIEKLQKMLDR